jgi:hypothetical protein
MCLWRFKKYLFIQSISQILFPLVACYIISTVHFRIPKTNVTKFSILNIWNPINITSIAKLYQNIFFVKTNISFAATLSASRITLPIVSVCAQQIKRQGHNIRLRENNQSWPGKQKFSEH